MLVYILKATFFQLFGDEKGFAVKKYWNHFTKPKIVN